MQDNVANSLNKRAPASSWGNIYLTPLLSHLQYYLAIGYNHIAYFNSHFSVLTLKVLNF